MKRITALTLCIIITLSSSLGWVHTSIAQEDHLRKLEALEAFVINQFDDEVGLVRESPDESINKTFWVLSDNLLAYHALSPYHKEVADEIHSTLEKYGRFHNGLHEVLFGEKITLPLRTPNVYVLDEMENSTVKVEVRDGGLMDDWIDYADLLLYAALAKHNEGDDDAAIHYFTKATNMWNDVGLYDKPTRQDGHYTTHKLALMLYVSKVLDQPLPFNDRLQEILWKFQREDGGVRSHYLGNLTSTRETNTETACLVILAYNYGFDETKENIEKATKRIEEVGRENFWSGQAKYMAGIALEEYNASNKRFEQRDFNGANQHAKSSIELVNIAYAAESDFISKIKMILVILVGLSCVISIIAFSKKRMRRK